MATRVLSVEVKQIGDTKDEDSAARKQLLNLCGQVQQATNYVWVEWLVWHHTAGSADKIRAWQAAWIAYKNSGGEKPKLDVRAVPNELSHKLYHGVTERWPDLHTRVVALLLNRLTSGIGSLKASKGAFSGWHAILLHHQAIPTFTRPLPLLFDTPKFKSSECGKIAKSTNGNAKLMLPIGDDASHTLTLKLAREAVEGRSTKASVEFKCTIWDRGRQMAGRRNTLKQIARGEYQMLGSQLCFDRGKVFAQITYTIPDVAPLELTGTALVTPGRRRPCLLRINERNKWIGGDGRVVLEVRRQLLRQRLGRKSAYRWCPTSNSRGHGLHRAIDKVAKLTRRWRDFAKTMNGQMAAQIRAECLKNGIGVLIVGRPKKDSRFLSNAGVEDWRDATSWDWFGLEKRINEECNEFGIRVIFRGTKPPLVSVAGASDGKPAQKKQKATKLRPQG